MNHRANWFHEIFYKWEKICVFPHCECAWINVSYVTYLMLKMRVNFRNFHTVILKYRKCLRAMCKILKFTYSYKSAPFMNSMILLLFNWYQYKFNPFCWYTSVPFSMLSCVSVSVSMCVSAQVLIWQKFRESSDLISQKKLLKSWFHEKKLVRSYN